MRGGATTNLDGCYQGIGPGECIPSLLLQSDFIPVSGRTSRGLEGNRRLGGKERDICECFIFWGGPSPIKILQSSSKCSDNTTKGAPPESLPTWHDLWANAESIEVPKFRKGTTGRGAPLPPHLPGCRREAGGSALGQGPVEGLCLPLGGNRGPYDASAASLQRHPRNRGLGRARAWEPVQLSLVLLRRVSGPSVWASPLSLPLCLPLLPIYLFLC